jgi:hypothetical protein
MDTLTFRPADIAVPFRMQPGLERIARNACRLTPLTPGSTLHTEKLRVVRAQAARFTVPGFDEAPVLAAIEAHAPAGSGVGPPELRFEEDFAVLQADSARIPWMRVCVPSHWAPEEKIGLPLAAIHAPVADNATLLRASQALSQLVCDGQHWQRHVWTLSPCARYDQHPHRHKRTPWPDAHAGLDPAQWAAQCWWRIERQTFLPVPGHRLAVFAIRVQRQPLRDAVATADDATRLRQALQSMSDAVLDYKGLRAAREPVLRWLDTLRWPG